MMSPLFSCRKPPEGRFGFLLRAIASATAAATVRGRHTQSQSVSERAECRAFEVHGAHGQREAMRSITKGLRRCPRRLRHVSFLTAVFAGPPLGCRSIPRELAQNSPGCQNGLWPAALRSSSRHLHGRDVLSSRDSLPMACQAQLASGSPAAANWQSWRRGGSGFGSRVSSSSSSSLGCGSSIGRARIGISGAARGVSDE